MTLLQRFIDEECSHHVRGLLQTALRHVAPSIKRFEFNRFEVSMDRDTQSVLIEDVLDASAVGVERLPLV